MSRLVLLVALVAATGCANLPSASRPGSQVFITPGAVPAERVPVLRVEVPRLRARATMRPDGQNGTVRTWRSADDVAVLLDDGLLVATRGLGFDLMSADPGPTRQHLLDGSDAPYERFYAHLDGESRVVFSTFICRVEARNAEAVTTLDGEITTTRVEEGCRSTDRDVTNVYWIAPDGMILRSRQWISGELGYLSTALGNV